MANAIRTITLDVSKENDFVYYAKQSDALSRFLKIKFVSNGTPITPEETDSIVFTAKRQDGKSIVGGGTVGADGTVTVEFTSSMLAAVGEGECEVAVISENGAVLTSLSFVFVVEEKLRNDGAIAASNEFPIFTKAIAEMAKLEKELEASEEARNVFEQYDSEKEYVAGNKVAFDGSGYVCIKDCCGVVPSDTEHWLLFASKGEKGEDGVGNLIDNIEDAGAEGSVQSADGSGVSLGDFCFSFGDNVIMGCRGFYIQAIDFNSKKIYLGNTKLSGLPKVGAGSIDESVDLSGYAVGDKFSIINGVNYSLCGTIASIENNVIGYTWEDPRVMNGFSEDTGIDGHTFCVPSKPTVGAVSFITTVSGFGRDLKGAANYCFLGGRNLLAAGAYTAIFGRNNTANYGSFNAGMNNDAGEAFAGVTLGHENKSKYQYTNIIGRGLEAAAMYQVLRGRFNLPDATLAEIFGGGADANNRWNIRTLDWNGNGWYKGTLYVGGTGLADGKEVATKEYVDSILGGEW